MRPSAQVLILIGLAVILFGIARYLNTPLAYGFAYGFYSVFTILLGYLLWVKPLNQLNQDLKNINLNNQKGLLPDYPHTQAKSLSDQVNLILSKVEQLHLTNKEIETNADIIKKKNIQLQHEISEYEHTNTKLTQQRETLSKLAHYDSLTALPNRIFFNEILNKAMSHARRHNKICALLLVDIDSFKNIIATHGHDVGDRVLKETANRFVGTLRSEDIIAKLDGDEYIILLSDINKTKFASSVAEKLLLACAKPIKINDYNFSTTASIGIAIYPNDGDSLETLISCTQDALNKAKRKGGNTYQFFTQEMDIEAQEFILIETELRRAIQNNELTLNYQPKLNIKKGRLTGIEALLRWSNPKIGSISPKIFIPIAEETGLINQLGEWALREACKTNKHWQDEGFEHMTISINLSPKQFLNPNIANVIANVLSETGLNPKYLEIEINEATIMDNIDAATNILKQIKETNVQISIDHFGTGYTSISHLKKLPVNILKIDPSFIQGIPHKPNDSAITTAFVSLAHNLGLEVVAEGVETAEQVEFLALQNCDMVQGYFLSHPLSAQKIEGQFTKLRDDVIL